MSLIKVDGMSLIKVDLDLQYSAELREKIGDRIRFISEILNVTFRDVRFWRSKSGNVHVTAVLRGVVPLSDREIIIVQLALGSDYMREVYNLRRLWRCQRNWNILFEHEEIL